LRLETPSAPVSDLPQAFAYQRRPLPRAILKELRPKQWLKNGLVFFGLVYALHLGNLPLVVRACIAFAAFCCISSAGYVFNDLKDVELDRRHPTKRFRPIAASEIPQGLAWALAVGLFAAGFGLAFSLGIPFAVCCLVYVAITLSYSQWLKHHVLLDVFCVSAGFVVRTVAGAVAVAVPISPWLYMCTILGSLIIALGKRRAEIIGMEDEAESHRPALEHYTVGFLDNLIMITATASIMAYSLYTFSAENVPRNHVMMITIPIVLYGVFRYIFLLTVKGSGGAPEDLLLSDRSLAVAVVLFLVVSAGILYAGSTAGVAGGGP
jgi:4-hydroxybenzoate polyprenyltransferase